MKSLFAFLKKDYMEQIRSGKLLIVGALFLLFGIMNPAIAKLTPWLLEVMADSLAESGMAIEIASVSAMDSWVQFFKNMPMALIAFVLLQSAIFTKEYTSGTLVLSLTKGLKRYQVVLSKSIVLVTLWTLGYWLCFGITYAYNAYFWDNSIAQNLELSVLCWWIFGIFVLSLQVLFSTLSNSNTGVLIGTGGIVLAFYTVAFLPKVNRYLPIFLTDGKSLIYGLTESKSYTAAMVITAIASLVCFATSIPIFNKKQL